MLLFKESANVFKKEEELFGETSWVQVMMGQGLMPEQYHPIVDLMDDNELQKFLDNIKLTAKRKVDNWPHHLDFIERYCKAKVK
jgi:tryptophan halogenase